MLILEKKKMSQINTLSFRLKNLEKEDQNKAKARRRQKIIKIRVEINEFETEK